MAKLISFKNCIIFCKNVSSTATKATQRRSIEIVYAYIIGTGEAAKECLTVDAKVLGHSF